MTDAGRGIGTRRLCRIISLLLGEENLNLNSEFDLLRDVSSETKTDCLDLTLCRLRVQKAAGRYW